MTEAQHQSRIKLLEAALSVFRAKGHAATTVDDICARAGVTKGSFFHHFKSKEDLVLSAVAYWNEWTGAIFASAPYHKASDPRDRILGYIEFRLAILDRDVPEFTCLLGTLVQEIYATHPSVRQACDAGMASHIATLTRDIEEAKKIYAPHARWSPQSLGYFMQSVLQGSFIFAKSTQGADVARENLSHLKRYVEMLFTPNRKEK